jgi:hypothetical protein
VHERLRKLVALAVFSSDAISSTAYGTEQIMLILVTAGAVATGLALPIALGIGGLLGILIRNYSGAEFGYPVVGSSASSPLSWVLSCHSRLAAAESWERALDSAGVHFSK